MSKKLLEQVNLTEAATSSDTSSGVLEVEFITPGWGSSGYYSRQVLEAAAPLFTPGLQMFMDHPSASENTDRPERSVRDIGAILLEAGHVDKSTGGIRGKVKVVAPYRELLTDEDFVTNIGVSIRGSATDITVGEAEGRTGPIIEGLADIQSVDFVTRAGRGGKVLGVLESARQAAVHEATAADRHRQLQTAVRAAYDGPNRWVYVRDHDADERVVWFDISSDGPTETWQQTYDVADNDVDITLTGDPIRVSAVTTYIPVGEASPAAQRDSLAGQLAESEKRRKSAEQTARLLRERLGELPTPNVPVNPAGRTTTEASKEDTMGNIQIDEAEHRSLVERAGRVDTLESERDTAVRERDEARRDLAERYRIDAAHRIVSERAAAANVTFTPLEERGLLATLPTRDDGSLDEAAFTTAVDEAAITVRESRGEGQVRGFGGGTTVGNTGSAVSESDIDTAVAGAFGRTVKEA